jgi:hypothetical protein
MSPFSKSLHSDKSDKSWKLQLREALAKADENSRLAASAKNSQDQAYYQRVHRKWLGIADGWRMINNVDKIVG